MKELGYDIPWRIDQFHYDDLYMKLGPASERARKNAEKESFFVGCGDKFGCRIPKQCDKDYLNKNDKNDKNDWNCTEKEYPKLFPSILSEKGEKGKGEPTPIVKGNKLTHNKALRLQEMSAKMEMSRIAQKRKKNANN